MQWPVMLNADVVTYSVFYCLDAAACEFRTVPVRKPFFWTYNHYRTLGCTVPIHDGPACPHVTGYTVNMCHRFTDLQVKNIFYQVIHLEF